MCRFCHLPSNGVIVKIALRDLDLLFEGQINIFTSLKRQDIAQKYMADSC